MDTTENINTHQHFTKPEHPLEKEFNFEFDEAHEASFFLPVNQRQTDCQHNLPKDHSEEENGNPFLDMDFLDLGEEIPYGLKGDFRVEDDEESICSDDNKSSLSYGHDTATLTESSVTSSIKKFNAFLNCKGIPDIRTAPEFNPHLPREGETMIATMKRLYDVPRERCCDDIVIRDNVIEIYSDEKVSRKTFRKMKQHFRRRKMTDEEVAQKVGRRKKDKEEERRNEEAEKKKREEDECRKREKEEEV